MPSIKLISFFTGCASAPSQLSKGQSTVSKKKNRWIILSPLVELGLLFSTRALGTNRRSFLFGFRRVHGARFFGQHHTIEDLGAARAYQSKLDVFLDPLRIALQRIPEAAATACHPLEHVAAPKKSIFARLRLELAV